MDIEVLGADWVPTDDMDLINRRLELDAAFDRTVRKQQAYDYISRAQSRRMTAFVERLLLGSVLFFIWAVLLALLV